MEWESRQLGQRLLKMAAAGIERAEEKGFFTYEQARINAALLFGFYTYREISGCWHEAEWPTPEQNNLYASLKRRHDAIRVKERR